MSQERDQALQALEAGDAQGAYQALRPMVEYPSDDPDFGLNMAMFARVLRELEEPELASVIVATLATPNDPQRLYELGYELIEHGLHAVSANVLRRANAFAPGVPTILAEFVHALETLGHNRDACEALQASPVLLESDFLCRYLLAFNSMMCAEVEAARDLMARLLQTQDPDEAFMARRIETMLLRGDVLTAQGLDLDLRAWHFIQHGAILAHLSPHGIEAGMSGRYAFVQESSDLVHQGLLRLQAILEVWDRRPERVYMFPDRGSEIIAQAAAKLLEVPLVPWPKEGTQAPGLLATHDLTELERDHLLSAHDIAPGQLLFSQAACWTQVPPYASDIVTFLYQVNAAPWEGQLTWDPDAEEMTHSPADERPSKLIASEVLDAPIEDAALDDLRDMMRFARAVAKLEGDAAPQGLWDAGQRQRFWECSPIKSGRF